MEPVEKLGKYEIKGTLGRGAMGVVYEGWDPTIQRIVAIKTIPITDTDDAETQEGIARFRREAQAAGRLTHPNIVSVFDYGETRDLAYIVMEFVNGPSLKELMGKDDRFALADTVKIMQDVLAGLEHSHEQGVVHRDIKPANLMLTSRERARARIKISDFGIARIESSSMTQAGVMMGTPTYMSPEQFMGQPVDARTDLYACGVLLYQLLTGERPFEGGLSAIMHKVLNTDPIPPSRLSLSVTPALDAVVLKAMAKRPADRFRTAIEFAEVLTAAANGLSAVAASGAEAEADDATMVAGPAHAQSAPPSAGLEETMAMTPSPVTGMMPAMAAPVPHDATMIAPRATPKRGIAMPIIAGALAGLVVVGGAAYVLTRPSAPSAPVSLAPVAPLPHPASPPKTEAPATPAAPPIATAPAAPPPASAPPASPSPAAPSAASPSAASPSAASPSAASPSAASPSPAAPSPAAPSPAAASAASPSPAATAPAAATPASPAPASPGPQPAGLAAARPIAPAVPPPASGPDIADIRNRFSQIVAGQTCSLMNGSVSDQGTVTLTGIAGPGVRDDVRDALAGTTIPLLWRTMAADSVFCQPLNLLRPIGTPFAAAEPRLALTLADDRTALHDGQRIRPRLLMPDFPGYARIDYVTHDGSVQHLYPQIADSSGIVADKVRALNAGERLALGDPPKGQPAWEVGPPYGTDMIIAVVSSQPLLNKPRPSNVEHADAYLHDLASAIRTAQHAGMRVIGNALLVDTLPK